MRIFWQINGKAISYSGLPFTVDLEKIRFLLTWRSLAPPKDCPSKFDPHPWPWTRQSSCRPAWWGCHYQFRKTRPPGDLPGRVTPARETQDSRKYGFDSPLSHYFLDWRPQKISCSVYIYCANWVSGRAKRQKICTIIACEKHLKKGKLHRRILRKMKRKGAANWVSTTL